MNWQPIETAPMDGTPILGFDGSNMTTIYYWKGRIFPGEWSLCAPGLYAEDDEYLPTHWMPLPEPPK